MISSFNKKSIAGTVIALSLVFMVGCSSTAKTLSGNSNSTNAIANKTNSNASSTNNVTNTASTNKLESDKINKPNKQENVAKQNSTTTNNSNSTPVSNNNKPSQASTKNYGDISLTIKNYILNGQGNKSEALKYKWSPTFLNRVDIESLYKQYIANGGHADDLESFANYMTLNAPIPSDWKDLFEKDLYDKYGVKVVRLEHLNDDLYQAYIEKDGSEIPYVVVSSRTGYFHG
ncbi:MAG: hypothetical protein ABF633_05645 [Clostridium sp.]|uniref:hypothetical protein n=1 Tax=Clostridium sp. TaxID=1506 RepID=UPI0039ED14FE